MRTPCTMALALVVTAAGCNTGVTTIEEMKRRAIKRPSEDDAAPPVTAPPKPAATTAKPQPGTPATPAAASPPVAAVTPPANPAAKTEQPAPPLTPAQGRQRTLANLRRIAEAFQAFVKQNRYYPPPAASYDDQGKPLLSWRVQLLPYLGHDALYQQFKLNQPWDSPHNRKLLAAIPPEYQSPERWDEKTNYLVPVGDSDALFTRIRRTVPLSSVEDGPDNTLLLLEADDDRAVPWTKPEDYAADYRRPAAGLGQLRGGQFFAVWADGLVGQVSVEDAAKPWRALLTIAGGEAFSRDEISRDPSAAPARAAAPTPAAAGPAPPSAAPAENVAPKTPAERPAVPAAGRAAAKPARHPVPGPAERQRARHLLRQIYEADYEKAKTARERRALADKLVAELPRFKDDPTAQFAALELARTIAVQAGAIELAVQTVAQAARHFEIDAARMQAEVLENTVGMSLSGTENDRVYDTALPLTDALLRAGEYDLAERVCAAGLAAARRKKDSRRAAEMTARSQELAHVRSAIAGVGRAIDRLNVNPDDADANTTVAVYYCFIKDQWAPGLPLLARGRDLRLAELARRELQAAAEPDQHLTLADGWWDAAQANPRHRRALLARAAHWYDKALPQLPPGLERIKAETRLQQCHAAPAKSEPES